MHVWDLRRIREGLFELGLDWELPPYPKRDEPKTAVQPIDVEIHGEELWTNPQKLAEYERVAPLAALAVNPFDWEARTELGLWLLYSGKGVPNWEGAYRQLDAARLLNPDRFAAYLSLARTCLGTGRNMEAHRAATRAMEKPFPTLQAQLVRGQALFALGRIEEALVDFDFLVSKGDPNPLAVLYRAHCNARLGKGDKALDDYRAYYNTSKSPPDVLNSTARSLIGPGFSGNQLNPLSALACIEIALKKEGDNPRYLATLAAVEWELGRFESARSTLERTASRPNERDALYWYVLAKFQANSGDHSPARDSIAQGDAIRTKFRDTSPYLAARFRREALSKLTESQRSLALGAVVGSIAAMKK